MGNLTLISRQMRSLASGSSSNWVGTELLPSAVTARLKGWVVLAGWLEAVAGIMAPRGWSSEGGRHGGLSGDDDQVAAFFGDIFPEHFLLRGRQLAGT